MWPYGAGVGPEGGTSAPAQWANTLLTHLMSFTQQQGSVRKLHDTFSKPSSDLKHAGLRPSCHQYAALIGCP